MIMINQSVQSVDGDGLLAYLTRQRGKKKLLSTPRRIRVVKVPTFKIGRVDIPAEQIIL